jgi:hypothetical protein
MFPKQQLISHFPIKVDKGFNTAGRQAAIHATTRRRNTAVVFSAIEN